MLIILSNTNEQEKYSYKTHFSFRGYIEIYKLMMPFASEIDVRTARCARIELYSNVPKVFVKFVDVTLQMRCVTNLKCAQHRQYLANAIEISFVVILMLYIRPCKVTYLNVINLVIYQYGMQTWVVATWTDVLDAKCVLTYVKKGNRDGKIIYECIRYCKEILFPR